jgi:hypothetical protein
MNRDAQTLTLSAREIERIAQHMLREHEVRLWLWREGYSSASADDQRAMVAAQIWLVVNDPARQRARAMRGGTAVPRGVDEAVQITINSMCADRLIASKRNALQVKHNVAEHVSDWSAACSLDPLPPDSDLLDLLRDLSRQQPARPTPAPEAPVTA